MHEEMSQADMSKKVELFEDLCHEHGLKVTPQRVAVYKALVATDLHPTAEEVCRIVRQEIANISLDTVNRTLLTLTDIGAAFLVEGTGQPRRYDGGTDDHQHFRCIKCGKIVDFYHESFDNITVPDALKGDYRILRKTVYFEGLCELCIN
jgi:Fur family peroxide stress response transcriptional regulator